MGYAAADRSAGSAFPRALRKCVGKRRNAAGSWETAPADTVSYHATDGTCLDGDMDVGVIGYVF